MRLKTGLKVGRVIRSVSVYCEGMLASPGISKKTHSNADGTVGFDSIWGLGEMGLASPGAQEFCTQNQ